MGLFVIEEPVNEPRTRPPHGATATGGLVQPAIVRHHDDIDRSIRKHLFDDIVGGSTYCESHPNATVILLRSRGFPMEGIEHHAELRRRRLLGKPVEESATSRAQLRRGHPWGSPSHGMQQVVSVDEE